MREYLNSLRYTAGYNRIRKTLPFKIAKYLRYAWAPVLFRDVQIEVSTVCNRKCIYCPNFSVGRPQRFMEESVFFKIVGSLKEHDFRGSIVFSGYCEPLMDDRISSFVLYAKRQLPGISIRINTNGDFFTIEKYIELKNAGVDLFLVSQHSKEISDAIAMTLGLIKKRFPDDCAIGINDVYNSGSKMNRGGLVAVESQGKLAGCPWPSMLIFDYAGNIILCCNDYNSSVVFGNINKDDIYSVWYGRDFVKIRSKILSGFLPYEICRRC